MPDTTSLAHSPRNEPTGADAAETFEQRVSSLIEATNAWTKEVPQITSDEQAARAEDLLTQIREEDSAVEEARKAARKPHDDAVKIIQAKFTPLCDKLAVCTSLLKRLKAAWLAVLEERQAAERHRTEEAARKAAAEAEAARRKLEEAKGPAVQSQLEADIAEQRAEEAAETARRAARARPQVVGELGGRASGFRVHYSAKIVERRKVLDWYQGHPQVAEVIQQLADAEARDLKERFAVPGAQLVKERRV